jgi:hypothetical protein
MPLVYSRGLITPNRSRRKGVGVPRVITSLAPRGLQLCAPLSDPGFRLAKLASGPFQFTSPTLTNSPKLVNTPYGPGLNLAAANECVSYQLVGAQPPTNFSMEMLLFTAAATADGSFCGWNSSADGTGATADRDFYSGPLGQGLVAFHTFDGANKSTANAPASSYPLGLSHYVGTADGTTMRLYYNGAQAATVAAGAAFTGYTNPFFCIGRGSTQITTTFNKAQILLINFANAVWTPQEVFERYLNPFGFLSWPQDRRHYLVGVAAAPVLSLSSPVFVTQDQASVYSHPLPKLFSGFIPSLPLVPAVRRLSLVSQDQPTIYGHPLPRAQVSRQGPNVAARPQVEDSAFVVQDQPTIHAHPRPRTLTSRQGPNVRIALEDSVQVFQNYPFDHPVPRSLARVAFISSAPTVVPLALELIAQEYPGFHPIPRTLVSRQGPNVRTAVEDSAQAFQELPGHPLPRWLSGVVGPNVRISLEDSVTITQELPSHPSPNVQSSLSFLGLRILLHDFALVPQELPGHPGPRAQASRQGPDVANLPQIGRITVTQELPSHPAPRAWNAYTQPGAAIVLSSVTRIWMIRQEQPDHPSPRSRVSIQGPNVRSPVSDFALVQQLLPGHPLPFTTPSREERKLPRTDSVFVGQERPIELFYFSRSSLQGPNVRPSIADITIVPQERPGHPYPLVRIALQGPNVGSPVHNVVYVSQEQPLDLIHELIQQGAFKPALPFPTPGLVFIRVFEIYDHPNPFSHPMQDLGIADIGNPPRIITVRGPRRTIVLAEAVRTIKKTLH